MSTLFSPGRINSRPSNVIVRGWRREHHMMTPTPCEVGPSLSRTQTLIATRVPCGGWREQQGSGRPFTRTRNQKRLNNGRLGGNTPRPAAFPSEGHGARKCLPSDPCTVHSRQFQNGQPSISHPGGGKRKHATKKRASGHTPPGSSKSAVAIESHQKVTPRIPVHQIHILEVRKFRKKHAARTSSAGFHQNFKVDF